MIDDQSARAMLGRAWIKLAGEEQGVDWGTKLHVGRSKPFIECYVSFKANGAQKSRCLQTYPILPST